MAQTIVSLLLATQRALLGEVVPSLRAIAVDWEENTILIYFYNDGEISTELEHDYSSIAAEVVANYSDADVDDKIIRLDYPIKLPNHQYWAYRRKEIY